MKPLSECRLYAFVDTTCLRGRAPQAVAQHLCDGGADLIQLRAKQSPQVGLQGGYLSLQNDYINPNGVGVIGGGVEAMSRVPIGSTTDHGPGEAYGPTVHGRFDFAKLWNGVKARDRRRAASSSTPTISGCRNP